MSGKEEKELFYSNLGGTTAAEVAWLTLIGPMVLLLRSQMQPWLILTQPPVGKYFSFLFIVDFFVMVVPMVICNTVASSHIQQIALLLFIASGTLSVFKYGRLKSSVHSYLDSRHSDSKLSFVSSLRLSVLFSTTICILAVDFHIFPRRLAKTETFGVSLMDGGVGMFMFINGLVSSEARKKSSNMNFSEKLSKIISTLISSLPLLLLGLIRLLSVRLSDYHEHVSEYGVHWNFFLTLFLVRILSSILFVLIPVNLSGMLVLLITCAYQHLLTNCKLQDYILNGPDGTGSRIGLISANREGLFSCIGFTAIYIGGVCIGQLLFSKKWNFSGSVCLLGYLWLSMVLFWCALHLLPPYTGQVSRRLANTTYIFWIMAQGTFLLASFLLLDIFLAWQQGLAAKEDTDMFSHLNHPANQSSLLRSVNAHQLMFFLLANVLTGLVNLTINTLAVSAIASFVLVVTYMLVLCSLTAFVQYKNIKLL